MMILGLSLIGLSFFVCAAAHEVESGKMMLFGFALAISGICICLSIT